MSATTPAVDEQAITDAEQDVTHVQVKMINHRVTLPTVRPVALHRVMFIAMKSAFERVGDRWVAYRTQALRNRIEEFDKVREMVGRTMNTSWAICGGPSSALPVVAIGTLMDIALEAEEEVLGNELRRPRGRAPSDASRVSSTRILQQRVFEGRTRCRADRGERPADHRKDAADPPDRRDRQAAARGRASRPPS